MSAIRYGSCRWPWTGWVRSESVMTPSWTGKSPSNSSAFRTAPPKVRSGAVSPANPASPPACNTPECPPCTTSAPLTAALPGHAMDTGNQHQWPHRPARTELPIGWAAAITAQTCSVLPAAHQASLVHRNLKPSNLMLEPGGTVQTLATLSEPRTDLYALGCALYEMLTGHPVSGGASSDSVMKQQVGHSPPSARETRRRLARLLRGRRRWQAAADAVDRSRPFVARAGNSRT